MPKRIRYQSLARASRRRTSYSRYRSSLPGSFVRYHNRSRGRMAFTGRNRIALRNQRTGGLLGLEVKYLDTYAANTALTAPANAAGGSIEPSGGCTGCLSAPAQGDGPSNREGNKIVVKSIFVECNVSYNTQASRTVADPLPDIYIALVMDTQTNGATIASEEVFTNPSAETYQAAQPLRNMSWTSRFKVLATKRFTVRSISLTGSPTTGDVIISGAHRNVNLAWRGDMPVTFTTGSTTADVANVTNNSIHLIAFTSSTNLAVSLSYTSRIRFVG